MDFLLHDMLQFHFHIGSQRLKCCIFETPCVSRDRAMKRIVHKVNAVTSTEIPMTPETLNPRWIAGCIFPRLQSAIMIIRARAVNSSTPIQSIQSMLIALTDSPHSFPHPSFLFFLSFSFKPCILRVFLYFTKWQIYLYTMYDILSYLVERYISFWTRYLASIRRVISTSDYKFTLPVSISLQTHFTYESTWLYKFSLSIWL